MSGHERMRMKDLPLSERPYEKLEQSGAHSLSNAELFAIIFRTGSKKERAVETAQRLLNHGTMELASLFNLTIKELQEIPGIGRVKSLQVLAVLELSKRMTKAAAQNHYSVNSPSSIASLYMEELRHLGQEHFYVVFLNTKNEIINEILLTKGTVNASLVHPRDVFIEALKHNSVRIIILHNHPSGDPSPSKEDIHITNRLCECGEVLGIPVLDHIIIGDGKYASLKEKGYI